MEFERLLFGTAGVPNSTEKKNNPVEGVKRVHELGLDCMQLEFAHGVRMKDEVSSALRKISYELNVPLHTDHIILTLTLANKIKLTQVLKELFKQQRSLTYVVLNQ